MYSNEVLVRFKKPLYAGALRGANGTGKAGDSQCGDLIKIYLLVNDEGLIESAKFKAYGGVSTIVACDIACQMLINKSLEEALSITSNDILEELNGNIPESRNYAGVLVEEAISNAVEDYYKRKEREEKKALEGI